MLTDPNAMSHCHFTLSWARAKDEGETIAKERQKLRFLFL